MTSVLVRVPIERVISDPGNPRQSTDGEADATLVASVRKHGVLQPVRVFPADANGVHRIRTGHRRMAAAKSAGLKDVPVLIVEGEATDAELIVEQIIENHHRRDLGPLELARAYRRALDLTDGTAGRLAEELGVSAATVSRSLSLLDLPADVQALVEARRLPPASAYELAKLDDADAQRALAQRVADGGMTRDQLAAQSAGPSPQTAQRVKRVTCPLPNGALVTFADSETLTLDRLIESMQTVLAEARKAQRQNLDPSTLSKMLRDRARGEHLR